MILVRIFYNLLLVSPLGIASGYRRWTSPLGIAAAPIGTQTVVNPNKGQLGYNSNFIPMENENKRGRIQRPCVQPVPCGGGEPPVAYLTGADLTGVVRRMETVTGTVDSALEQAVCSDRNTRRPLLYNTPTTN